MSAMTAPSFTAPIRVERIVEMEHVDVRRPREHSVRLTRRGRSVVFVIGLLAAMLLGFLVTAGSSASPRAERTTNVVVAPGDTLWDIAAEHSAPGSRADMVAEIEQLNRLDGASIAVGQVLRVPAE